jgi:hypothetical protein
VRRQRRGKSGRPGSGHQHVAGDALSAHCRPPILGLAF